jgi:glycosyltransferase involved in cell wall biosynthesis
MAKVSVLVAVYNAAPYIDQCLDSLLKQTLDDIQIICIDDCSTDDSLSILNNYSLQDGRVEVIHLDENHGQAHARNVGLQCATGEYTCMLDADDWFSCDALEKAVDAFDANTDCVLFDVAMEWGNRSERYSMPDFQSLSGNEAFILSLTWQIHGLYMVRTTIHKQYPYDETCRLYSDDNTTRIHYLVSRQVKRCDGVYHYRQNPQSTTHVVSVRRFDYLRANESMKVQLLAHRVSKDALSLYENHRWLNLIDVYMFYHCHAAELPAEDREYGLSELRRVWEDIDRTLLNKKTITKFGYRPMSSWLLFRIQEWIYFTIRGFLGKNY